MGFSENPMILMTLKNALDPIKGGFKLKIKPWVF